MTLPPSAPRTPAAETPKRPPRWQTAEATKEDTMKIEEMQRLCERATEALGRVSQYRDEIWDQPVNMHSISNGHWKDDFETIRTAIEQLRKQPQEVTVEELREAAKGILPLLDVDCPDLPDDDAIGWQEDKEIPVTFGQVRRFKRAFENTRIIAPPAEKD